MHFQNNLLFNLNKLLLTLNKVPLIRNNLLLALNNPFFIPNNALFILYNLSRASKVVNTISGIPLSGRKAPLTIIAPLNQRDPFSI